MKLFVIDFFNHHIKICSCNFFENFQKNFFKKFFLSKKHIYICTTLYYTKNMVCDY